MREIYMERLRERGRERESRDNVDRFYRQFRKQRLEQVSWSPLLCSAGVGTSGGEVWKKRRIIYIGVFKRKIITF